MKQDAAFDHADVAAIVDEIMAKPELALVRLASVAVLFRERPNQDALYGMIGPALYWDDDLGDAARRIAQHGVNIATTASLDDRKRRRGAVLERLVYELLLSRRPGQTYHERDVELMHSPRSRRDWTHPKDVVVEGPVFEVYECKTDGMADIGDIDQLSDISTTARAEGTDARPTVATFSSEAHLAALSKTWNLTETIHGIGLQNLLRLRTAPPNSPIRPRA